MAQVFPYRLPVPAQYITQAYPDQIPYTGTDERIQRDLQKPQPGYPSSQRNDGSDPRKKPVQKHKKITVFPVPWFGPDDIFRFEEPVVPFDEKTPPQYTSNPKQEYKTDHAAQRGRQIYAEKMEPLGANEERAECSDGVPWDRWKYILDEGTQAQNEIDQVLGKQAERIKESVQICQTGYLLLVWVIINSSSLQK